MIVDPGKTRWIGTFQAVGDLHTETGAKRVKFGFQNSGGCYAMGSGDNGKND